MGESSSRTDRQVSAYIESFLNETMESIKEMDKKDDQPCYESDQPCYESDGCIDIGRHEIESLRRRVLPDGNGSIKEEIWPKSKTKIWKRKEVKAWLKVLFQRNGKDLITKFFRALRKIRKNYKKMAKKLKDYAKDITKDIDWKQTTRLIFLIAVIAVLTSAVIAFLISPTTAPIGLGLAAAVLSFFTILQDWYEIRFEEYEKKNEWEEESVSTALIKLDEKNSYFKLWAEVEFRNIKMRESFTGAPEELRQVANSSKRMLQDGRKGIKQKMEEVKNKAN